MDSRVVNSPVGTWRGTVRTPHRVNEVELRLTSDGKALLRTESSDGTGAWRSTGEGRFRFRVVEKLPVGCVVIDQVGQVSDDGFESSGTSDVYDGDGHLIRSVRPTLTAIRKP